MEIMPKLTKSFLNQINEVKNKTWEADLNLFEGVLLEELYKLAGYVSEPGRPSLEERLHLGVKNWKNHQQKEDHPAEAKEGTPSYPGTFSWRDVKGQNYVTPVKNQEFCNSCAAFGTLAVVESMARIETKKALNREDTEYPPELSEGQLFFKSPGDHNCLTGWNLGGALSYLQETGVIPARDFPYNHKSRSESLPQGWEKKATIIGKDVTLDTHYDMKKWLSEKGPLISAVQLHIGFLFYKEGVYKPVLEKPLGGHCISVIGYDDGKGAWHCKNSWGTHWGEQGFFWMAYGECGIDSQMIGIENFKTIYQEQI